MYKFLFNSILLFSFFGTSAQKQVSITIDDLPNAWLGESVLLHKIDSMKIPTAIFINEHKLEVNKGIDINKKVLESWIMNPLITVGNHTYSHARASISTFSAYEEQIMKGETVTRKLVNKHHKELLHFRFPYNDLGKDSLQQDSLKQLLHSHGYRIAPFTIESSDWMFNAVYKHYLKKENYSEAKRIGNAYVSFTLELFDFFDSITQIQYHRKIKQIYLCHDNQLNRDYLEVLIQKLKEKKYSFISFDDALTDDVYSQKNYYAKKYGITWVYRWIPLHADRMKLMQKEPYLDWIENEYELIMKK